MQIHEKDLDKKIDSFDFDKLPPFSIEAFETWLLEVKQYIPPSIPKSCLAVIVHWEKVMEINQDIPIKLLSGALNARGIAVREIVFENSITKNSICNATLVAQTQFAHGLAKANARDYGLIIVYYIGHGNIYKGDFTKSLIDGGNKGRFIAHHCMDETPGIFFDSVIKELNNFSEDWLLILDCCHAARILRNMGKGNKIIFARSSENESPVVNDNSFVEEIVKIFMDQKDVTITQICSHLIKSKRLSTTPILKPIEGYDIVIPFLSPKMSSPCIQKSEIVNVILLGEITEIQILKIINDIDEIAKKYLKNAKLIVTSILNMKGTILTLELPSELASILIALYPERVAYSINH